MNFRKNFIKIIGSQDYNKVESIFLFKYVFIPLAWPISCLFIALGISPNKATLLRLILIIISYLLILLHTDYVFIGFLLIYISLVMDCVDGQISRTQDSATHYGKFFDGLVDSILEITLPLIIAIAHYKISNDVNVLLLGFSASLIYCTYVNVLIRSSNVFLNSGIEVSEQDHKKSLPVFLRRLIFYFENRFLVDSFDIKYFVFPFLYFLNLTKEYRLFLCIIYTLTLIIFLFLRLHKSFYFLNVKRKSKTYKSTAD